MQPLFLDTRVLDERVRQEFNLTEDIMMENAALALEQEVWSSCKEQRIKSEGGKVADNLVDTCKTQAVLILAGSGNNGADGYALARRISSSKVNVTVCEVATPKSEMCKLQKVRAVKSCVEIKKFSEINLNTYNIIVDCIFGSGFHGSLLEDVAEIISKVNKVDAVRIACDVPTGLDKYGNAAGEVFCATITVTMGANKVCLYSDIAKDFVGKVVVSNLGVSKNNFCNQLSEEMLLEESDMILPHRKTQNVNKGSFGHAAVVTGDKIGAGVIAGSSALRFGAGLVTLVNFEKEFSCGNKIILNEDGLLPKQDEIIPYDLMCSKMFPSNTTAVALGMGLGRNNSCEKNLSEKEYFEFLVAHKETPCVLDADIFYSDNLFGFLKSRSDNYLKSCDSKTCDSNCKFCDAKIVLTPHPKEFVSLLEKCSITLEEPKDSACGKKDFFAKETLSVKEAVENRIELIKKFCLAFPGVVLLLKGANVTVGVKFANEENVKLFVNSYGTSALSKAGSGDVLSGMICSLLAQKYNSLDATISASLAHSLAASHFSCDFSLTPFSLMKQVALL